MAYIFYLQKELITKQDMLDTRMQTVEQYQIERLENSRRMLLKDSIARLQHDSIVKYEGKIRAGQVAELKQKGFWKE